MNIFYTIFGALWTAGKIQAALAASKCRLFQSTLSPTPTTTEAQLVAAEATFDGYAAAAIATWAAPYFDPSGGASIQSGLINFPFVAAGGTSNLIGGGWVEDSTGKTVFVFVFPAPIPMNMNGQNIPLDLVLNFGRNG